MISSTELLRIAKRLQNASGDLYRLVKGKDAYGKSWCVIGRTYEEALAVASEEMEAALVDSGKIGLEIEKQHLFDRALARTGRELSS